MEAERYLLDTLYNVADLLGVFHDLLVRVESGHLVLEDTNTNRVFVRDGAMLHSA